jgi:hypothetical protein
MYRIKESGRNGYLRYNAAMSTSAYPGDVPLPKA